MNFISLASKQHKKKQRNIEKECGFFNSVTLVIWSNKIPQFYILFSAISCLEELYFTGQSKIKSIQVHVYISFPVQ